MKKLAVFVEGLTEQMFVEKLVTEIFGQHAVNIDKRKVLGGRNSKRRFIQIGAIKPDLSKSYYVLVVDCSSDNRVKSEIKDQYESLVNAGYSAIVGIRDVYPDFDYAEVPKLHRVLKHKLKTVPIEVLFVLGVMEIETWFLAECTHFFRLNSALTIDAIRATCGFDPSSDEVEKRPCPSKDLDNIYKIAGMRYIKKRKYLQRTVDCLDYAVLYLELSRKISDLDKFVKAMDVFIGN